jgi:hypothetical protein
VPDALVGKFLLPGLLLQFRQMAGGVFLRGMGRCGKKAKPEKKTDDNTDMPHNGTVGVIAIKKGIGKSLCPLPYL